jgi:protein-disulfide isomerase
LPQIETNYVKTGKIKYVFRDFPLESIHPNAFKAAEAASCAGDQGKFWEMHDQLYANQTALKPADLPPLAHAIGLDITKFQQCLDTGKYAASIRKDIAEGGNAGVTGTPAFMLGVTEANGSKVKVLKVFSGAQPYAAFKEAIDTVLSPQKQ